MTTIFGTSGNDTLTGTSGNDSIYGQAGDDTLTGGLGNDTLQGGLGSDTYVFNLGDGQDTIFDNGAGSGEINTLQFGAAIAPAQVSVKESGAGDLVLSITGSTDKITLRSQLLSASGGLDQVVFADGTVWNRAALLALATAPTSGNDTFYGDYSANSLNGGAGNDTLSGGAGDDTLIGGTGNDTLSGGTGNDTYVFNAGDGQDTIIDNGATSGELNTLQLGTGILPGAVTVAEANGGSDLVISFAGSTDKITLRSQLLSASGGVDQVVFADGTVWNRAALLALATAPTSGNDTFYGDYAANVLSGGAGDDTLNGGAGGDTLSGGTGNDMLIGGAGNDTYLFSRGDGRDTILDNGTGSSGEVNTLQFAAGIAVGDVIVTEANGGSDLILSIAGSTDAVILNNQLLAKTGGVDQVVFADGTVWTRAALLALGPAPTGGNDVIYGDYAANTLSGGAGNDSIYGGAGDDTLSGGTGDDYLEGGAGNDTYLFARGDGHDRIFDNGAGSEVNTLQFGTGIVATDLIVTQANGGNDIVLSIAGTSDSVTLSNQFTGTTGGVDRVLFADGTVWDRTALVLKSLVPTAGDDIFSGDDGANTLAGGAGNDTLIGRGGADTYIYTLGDGHDIVDDRGSSDGDTLQLHGISAADVQVVRSGDNAMLLFGADPSGRLTLAQQFNGIGIIERIQFDDGTVWTDADILANATNGQGNIILGTDVGDTVIGTAGDDTIEGLRGNDLLQGGTGNDTYIFNLGDGQDSIIESGGIDALDFGAGITASNMLLQAVGDDLYVRFRNSDDSILVQSDFASSGSAVESVRFFDGASVDLTQPLTFTYIGTPANTVLTGSARGTNVFELGAGGDTVTAGSANDVVVFGRGTGHATVNLVGVGATLKLASGILASDVTVQTAASGDITFSLAGSGDSVTFVGASSKGLTTVLFANGTVWRQLNGTSGNDTLTGQSSDDTLTGGLGNDQLNGGVGSDTYVYSSGDGNDIISEGAASDGSVDKLVFTNITSSRVSLLRNDTDVTLVIAPSASGAGDGGSVILKAEVGASGQGVEQIVFADGTTWSPARLLGMLVSLEGTSGDDTLNGTSASDIIAGRHGNDTLNGGSGNDAYLYARGDGNDVINEGQFAGSDSLVLQNINPIGVSLVRNGNDLTLVIAPSAPGAADGGSVLLKVELDDSNSQGVERVVFDDGTIWTPADLRTKWLAQAATAGDDVINGFNADDTIRGGAGNDALNGASGQDTYIYAQGDGNDTITEAEFYNSGIDKVVLEGVNPGSVSLVRNGIDATLVIAPSSADAGDGGSILLKQELDDSSGRGIEQIVFADGTVWSRADLRVKLLAQAATAGNDVINGFNTDDMIRGGAGDDALNGGGGQDTYIYAQGDGNDTITEAESYNSGIDKVVLEGINPGSVSLVRNGIDATLVIAPSSAGAGDGGSILLKQELDDSSGRGIEQIVFADGTVWSRADLRVKLLAQAATAGDDVINGFNTDDMIRGGAGDDALNGGGGQDTYIYAQGDGNDTITEAESYNSGIDKVVLEGINPGSVSLVRNGIDATLVIAPSSAGAGDGGSILLKQELDDSSGRGIEQIVFADGTVWSRADLRVKLLAQAATAGDDVINGFNTDDMIRGGAGDDALNGGGGQDTYIYAQGDGNDTITEAESYNSGIDKVMLEGINPGSVSLVRNGIDATLVIAPSSAGAGDGGSILLKQELDDSSGRGIEQIVFADGTVWSRADLRVKLLAQAATAGNDVINGFNADDTIRGGAGDDALNGGGGQDTYIYAQGDGNDTITEAESYNSGIDKVVLEGINPGSVSLVRNGIDATLVIAPSSAGAGDGGSILLKQELDNSSGRGIEQIVFADGTVWSRADLRVKLLAQAATAGDDVINGFNTDDTISGGTGNDALNGGSGNDSYVYNAGDGNDIITEASFAGGADRLVLGAGLTSSDVMIGRSGNDVTLGFANEGGSIKLIGEAGGNGAGLEQIVFGDGTSWSQQTLLAMASAVGTTGNNILYGTTGNDTLDGHGGSDLEIGQGGNDHYIFNAGYGRLEIDNRGGSIAHGELDFGSGITDESLWFTQSGSDLLIQSIGSSDQIKVDNWFSSNGAALSEIKLSDGNMLDAQLNQLVSAMATFAVSNPSFNPATATQMPNDPSLQSTIAAAWHP